MNTPSPTPPVTPLGPTEPSSRKKWLLIIAGVAIAAIAGASLLFNTGDLFKGSWITGTNNFSPTDPNIKPNPPGISNQDGSKPWQLIWTIPAAPGKENGPPYFEKQIKDGYGPGVDYTPAITATTHIFMWEIKDPDGNIIWGGQDTFANHPEKMNFGAPSISNNCYTFVTRYTGGAVTPAEVKESTAFDGPQWTCTYADIPNAVLSQLFAEKFYGKDFSVSVWASQGKWLNGKVAVSHQATTKWKGRPEKIPAEMTSPEVQLDANKNPEAIKWKISTPASHITSDLRYNNKKILEHLKELGEQNVPEYTYNYKWNLYPWVGDTMSKEPVWSVDWVPDPLVWAEHPNIYCIKPLLYPATKSAWVCERIIIPEGVRAKLAPGKYTFEVFLGNGKDNGIYNAKPLIENITVPGKPALSPALIPDFTGPEDINLSKDTSAAFKLSNISAYKELPSKGSDYQLKWRIVEGYQMKKLDTFDALSPVKASASSLQLGSSVKLFSQDLAKLLPGHTYTVGVKALRSNSDGTTDESPWVAKTFSVSMQLDLKTTYNASSKSVDLSWSLPSFPTDTKPYTYMVARMDTGKTLTTSPISTTTFTDVDPGTAPEYKVSAYIGGTTFSGASDITKTSLSGDTSEKNPPNDSPTITEYSVNGEKNAPNTSITKGETLKFVISGKNLGTVSAKQVSLGLVPMAAMSNFEASDTAITFNVVTSMMSPGMTITVKVGSVPNWSSNSYTVAGESTLPAKTESENNYFTSTLTGTYDATTESVLLNWTIPKDGKPYFSTLLRDGAAGKAFNPDNSYTDADVEAGKEYIYKVMIYGDKTSNKAVGESGKVLVNIPAKVLTPEQEQDKLDDEKAAAKTSEEGNEAPTLKIAHAAAKKDAALGKVVISYQVQKTGAFKGKGFKSEVFINGDLKVTFQDNFKDGDLMYDYSYVAENFEIKHGDKVKIVTTTTDDADKDLGVSDSQEFVYEEQAAQAPAGEDAKKEVNNVKDANKDAASKEIASKEIASKGFAFKTPAALPNTTVDAPYSVTLEVINGKAPYIWSSEDLPDDFFALGKDGKITGKATEEGTGVYAVQVRDATGITISREFTIQVGKKAAAVNNVSGPSGAPSGGSSSVGGSSGSSSGGVVAGGSKSPVVKYFKFAFKTSPLAKHLDLKGNSLLPQITILVNAGVMSGYSKFSFGPNDTLTRAQFLKMVVNAFQLKSTSTKDLSPCKDVAKSAWYASYFVTAKNLNIIKGYQNGTCKPDQAVTRAEATKILFQAIANIDGKTQTVVVADGGGKGYVNPFTDVTVKHPLFQYVASAEKYGFVKGLNKTTFAPDVNLTRAQAAKILVQALAKLAVK